MSEPKLISPLLSDHMMGDPISSHHGICCCPAIKKDCDDKYIVKILSIPASQVQLDALLLTGAYATKEAALAYFKELADSVVEEAEALKKLSEIDEVAYVRFASVYRQFRDINTFMDELTKLLNDKV